MADVSMNAVETCVNVGLLMDYVAVAYDVIGEAGLEGDENISAVFSLLVDPVVLPGFPRKKVMALRSGLPTFGKITLRVGDIDISVNNGEVDLKA